ncbi:MAG: tRNA pseudouridine(55) synthase TruB [Mesonia hippocampi]|uniref:tRNA pseudouridine(55) synthase TruB n=1 Tax=Mesonia hippocampi TaxID=1628250 RepID=UPI003F9D8B39
MSYFTEEDFKNGQILLFDKPLHWTSFQLVNKVRWLIRKTYGIKKIKVGHAGTLDPLATGLLIICTGKYTKKIPELQGQIKTYTGTFTMGATTPSYDLETKIDQHYPTTHLHADLLHEATENFTGEISQYPPVFSALKKDGKRLYEYARKGQDVEIEARKVEISDFTLSHIQLPEVSFEVTCSKGTYIRSLAHDFGKEVKSGAHLSALRRTKIGDFLVSNALTLETFSNQLPK